MQIHRFYDHDRAQADLEKFHPDIDLDLQRQPGLFSYYNSQLSRAEAQYDRVKHVLSIVEAAVGKEVRAQMRKDGEKATDSVVAAAVTLNPKVRKMHELLREARSEVNYLKGTCEAFRQRRDSLMQMAFNRRHEFKGSMQVMAGQEAQGRSTRAQRAANLMNGVGAVAPEDESQVADIEI